VPDDQRTTGRLISPATGHARAGTTVQDRGQCCRPMDQVHPGSDLLSSGAGCRCPRRRANYWIGSRSLSKAPHLEACEAATGLQCILKQAIRRSPDSVRWHLPPRSTDVVAGSSHALHRRGPERWPAHLLGLSNKSQRRLTCRGPASTLHPYAT